MKILFTTWPDVEYQAVALTQAGAANRLVSFYFARNLPPGFIAQYVRDGMVLSEEMRELVEFFAPLQR